MSIQELPHDGVAADAPPAVSAPATPTPPTRVSVAAAASTLLLMDINSSSLGTHSHALRTAVSSWPPQRTSDASPIVRHAAGLRRPDPDRTADLTGLAVMERGRPGEAWERAVTSAPLACGRPTSPCHSGCELRAP